MLEGFCGIRLRVTRRLRRENVERVTKVVGELLGFKGNLMIKLYDTVSKEGLGYLKGLRRFFLLRRVLNVFWSFLRQLKKDFEMEPSRNCF